MDIFLVPACRLLLMMALGSVLAHVAMAQDKQARNPVIHADVPDLSMVRVGDAYYMSSTTMHMSPGVPIMKSNDLVNWKLISYAYEVLDTVAALELRNGQNAYGKGSWASSIRYHEGTFYVSTFAQTTNKTYIFSTRDPEKGPWQVSSFSPSYHDHTLFFDDDGRKYLIWGGGELSMAELKEDLSGLKPATERVLIQNATAPAGGQVGLPAEGSQLFKVKGKYYLFNIAWPKEGMRTVIIHRADKITGPYEGRVALQDKGVAQGGLIDTPDGQWFAYLFRDYGAVGRIPYLVPVSWEKGWPVLGEKGKVPEQLALPASRGLMPGIVASDDFDRQQGEPDLPLVWQWNHNPDQQHWSVSQRKGYLRLTTARMASDLPTAINTLTQRTIGPESSGTTAMEVGHMQEGDRAGLALLQQKYGWVGVSYQDGVKAVVMHHAQTGEAVEEARIPLNQETVYLKATCDFRDRKDVASFYYSLDGENWNSIGTQLHMEYSIPHFMGYRFGLFNYATQKTGGYVDLDFFHISNSLQP